MKIKFGTVWLAHDAFPAFDVRVNGRLAVQEVDFLRAATAGYFARSNRKMQVSFRTYYKFTSRKLAEEFVLAHMNDLPNQANAYFYCGTGSDVSEATLPSAVLSVLPEMDWKDVSVRVLYALAGGAISGIQAITNVSQPLPYAVSTMLTGSMTLTQGVSTAVVTGANFPTSPAWFSAQVLKPVGGANVLAFPVAGSQSQDGFSFDLSADVPATGYQLMWSARL